MDAIALLRGHHRGVEELFSRIGNTGGHERQRVFRELFDALVAHAAVEREIFYPACERVIGDHAASEAVAEHDLVEFALYRCELELRDTSFDVHLGVLQEMIGHHVSSEESNLFPRVEQALDAAVRSALGGRMQQHFEALLKTDCQAALRDRLKHVLGDTSTARTKRSGDRKLVSRRAGARAVR
jgi:hemerythrin superfamily protein